MTSCPDVKDLAQARLERDGSLRPHLERCPRCRALLASYEAFLREGDIPGTKTADARVRMMGALEQAMDQGGLGRVARHRDGGGLLRLVRGLFEGAYRPIVATGAVAAAVLITAGVLLMDRGAERGGPGLLRGSEPTEDRLGATVTVSAGEHVARFVWRRYPEADAYALSFLDANLAPVGRIEALADTAIAVPFAALPGGGKSGTVLLWRIAALQDGDEVARSAAAGLRIP